MGVVENSLPFAEANMIRFLDTLADKEDTFPVKNGDVVALHNKHHIRFVRLTNGCVDAKGGCCEKEELPLYWVSEQFVAVKPDRSAFPAESLFSFYSISHRRFIRVDSENKAVLAGPEKRLSNRIDIEEVFDVVEIKKTFDGSIIALRSPLTATYMRMTGAGIDMQGIVPSSWEFLQVKMLQPADEGLSVDSVEAVVVDSK